MEEGIKFRNFCYPSASGRLYEFPIYHGSNTSPVSILTWIAQVMEKEESVTTLLVCYPGYITNVELVWMIRSFIHWKEYCTEYKDIVEELFREWVEEDFHQDWTLGDTKLLEQSTSFANDYGFKLYHKSSPQSAPPIDNNLVVLPYSILDLETVDVVNYFSSVDQKLRKNISLKHFLAFGSGDTSHLMPLTSQFNSLYEMFSIMVIRCEVAEERALVIDKLSEIAYYSLEVARVPNYSLAMSILCTLQSSAICRLKKTFSIFSKLESYAKYLKVKKILSSEMSFYEYRNHLQHQDVSIMYMGLIFTELRFIFDCQTEKKLSMINLKQQRKIVLELKGYHENTKKLESITFDYNFYVAAWAEYCTFLGPNFENEIFARSLSLEPRSNQILKNLIHSTPLDDLWESVKDQLTSTQRNIARQCFPNIITFAQFEETLLTEDRKALESTFTILRELLQTEWDNYFYDNSLDNCISYRTNVILAVESRMIYLSRILKLKNPLEFTTVRRPTFSKSARK